MTGADVAALIRAHRVDPRSRRCACGHQHGPDDGRGLWEPQIDHLGDVVAFAAAQHRQAAQTAYRGQHAVPVGQLTMADLGALVKLPPLGEAEFPWGMLLGLDRWPAADGTTAVTLEVLIEGRADTLIRTLAGGELVELRR